MDNIKNLIIISLLEGRNFPVHDVSKPQKDQPVVYFEARFNGQVLVSDPYPLTPKIEFGTELAWEIDRKSLRTFKIEKKPIKLQCFIESSAEDKTYIGYIIFDLRGAQEKDEPKYDWKPLLSNKYKGPSQMRPELLIALQLLKSVNEDNNVQLTEPNDDDDDEIMIIEEIPKRTVEPEFENDIRVKLKDGFFHIWDSKKCDPFMCIKHFKLSITILYAKFLYKLVKLPCKIESDLKFYLKFIIFGTPVVTDPFTNLRSCDFIPEKISFNIATPDLNILKIYLEINSSLEILLCDSNNMVLGFTTVNLKSLCTNLDAKMDNAIQGQFKMISNNEVIGIEDPYPVVGVLIELESGTNSDDLKILENTNKSEPKKVLHSTPQKIRNDVTTFCFTIDLRTLKVVKRLNEPLNSCYIQYSYPFFGFLEKVRTSPPVQISNAGDKVTFVQGCCAFNFSCSYSEMQETFESLQLILEIINEDKITTLIGTGKINLAQAILNVAENDQRKKLNSISIPIFDINGEEFAEVNVIMCLQFIKNQSAHEGTKMAAINYPGIIAPKSDLPDSDLDTALNDILLAAAMEIEIWKGKQIEIFQQDLEQKELEYLSEFEKQMKIKENEHKVMIQNKMKQMNEIEEKLKEFTNTVKDKEDNLNVKEAELVQRQKQVKKRYELLDAEISNAIEEIKATYDKNIAKEKEKNGFIEAENRRLVVKLKDLNKLVKEHELKIEQLENKLKISSRPNGITAKRVSDITYSKSSDHKHLKETSRARSLSADHSDGKRPVSGTKANNALKPTNKQTSITWKKSEIMKELKREREDLLKLGVDIDSKLIKQIDKHTK